MTERTRKELKRCIDYLACPNPDDPDHETGREGAIRGLNDWFLQSLIDDGLFDPMKVKLKGGDVGTESR